MAKMEPRPSGASRGARRATGEAPEGRAADRGRFSARRKTDAVDHHTGECVGHHEPEGNGCAERFIRTLKENLLWVRTFETVEDLRQALLEFKRLYNAHWFLERLGYRTPAQARKEACSTLEVAA